MVNKKIIIKKLLDRFSSELEIAQEIVDKAHELLTQDDMKQEGKYDTRRVEAGYLAGAQKIRLEEIKMNIEHLTGLEIRDYSKTVVLSSLINCLKNNIEDLIFLTPSSGGLYLEVENKKIHVISINSPLGQALVGLESGDIFELKTPKGEIEYEILEVY